MNSKYMHDDFGTYRSVQPKGYFPYSAWELDNDMEITDHEVLIDVKLLNIDMSCFLQLMENSYGDKAEIARRIRSIVLDRGKLHNAVTGTGGTLLGTVARIGKNYSNRYGIAEGDDIISLSSLTGVPLSISRIKNIDTDMAQVEIDGSAVLFENSPVIKKSDILPDDVQLSAFEAAGEAAETCRLIEPGDRVIIVGALGKFGLICGLAARRRLGDTGQLVGVIDHPKKAALAAGAGAGSGSADSDAAGAGADGSAGVGGVGSAGSGAGGAAGSGAGGSDSSEVLMPDEMAKIFDRIVTFEANDIAAMSRELDDIGKYDVVINCSHRPVAEPACVMLPRRHGKVFFANLGANSKTAGLAAEILGKELSVHYYHGYLDDQENALREIIADTPDFERLVRAALVGDFRYPWIQILDAAGRLFKLSKGIIEDSRSYVFESPKSLELLSTLMRVARYDCNILISGETGVGKEIAAEIIHKKSWRKNGKLVKINCASIPEHLLETELFGYVGGAFTGSDPKGKKGLWEEADEGVLFLDEIGEMPLALQAKLLRTLEENELFRVGGNTPIKVNVRVLAATNKNLVDMVRQKTFREDLYYRLNVFYLHVPPLRERREDILPMVGIMLRKYNDKYGTGKTLDPSGAKLLETFPWYGNVRELDNFVQKVFIDSAGNEITVSDINRHTGWLQPREQDGAAASGASVSGLGGTGYAASGASDGAGDGASGANAVSGPARDGIGVMDEKEMFRYYKEKYGSTRKIAGACGMSQSSVARRLRKYGLS
ncbi:MAG: sigma 54-interacting transcriptional regulator [Clostridiales Family XIII bacterium]|jgi:DNA-binding NtrC family response regulator/threonine dehydrogenase-like Zn-dependent dehydrogenase|nr:sigma 54-interacting transcriptional regulator [Clostridiales Family XIII bacterium]